MSAVEAKIIFIGLPPVPPVPRWSQKWGTLSPALLGCADHVYTYSIQALVDESYQKHAHAWVYCDDDRVDREGWMVMMLRR